MRTSGVGRQTSGVRFDGLGLGMSACASDAVSRKAPRSEVRRPRSALGLRQEFVLVDHGGYRYFAIAVIDTHDSSLAANPDAFGQSDFRRQGQSKFDGRARERWLSPRRSKCRARLRRGSGRSFLGFRSER